MSTYAVTYHFKTVENAKTGNNDERPIYYAFNGFLAMYGAIGDNTTSTKYFNFDGGPQQLAEAICDYFENIYNEDVTWDEKDYISVIELYPPYDESAKKTRVPMIGRIYEGHFNVYANVMVLCQNNS